MKKASFVLLSASLLLSSCGQQSGSGPQPTQNTNEIPDVPRQVATSYSCTSGAAPLAALLNGNALDQGNVIHKLGEQATSGNSVGDMLYAAKYLLNVHYFGYGISDSDLQKLHATAYQNFKKTYPNSLSSYAVDSKTDALMDDYINGVQDEHTYYMDAAQYDNYIKESNNQTVPTPVFGIVNLPVPDGDGVVIINVRGEGNAYKAGLRRGDVLLSIDGQELKRTIPATKTASGSLDDSQQSTLYTKILAAAAAKQTEASVTVRRGSTIRTLSMAGAILNGTQYPWGEVRLDTAGHKFYYLRIPTFEGDGIASKVHALVADANAQGVSGVVVDLRNNGGGLLREYLGAVAAFVPDKASQQLTFVDASQNAFTYNNGTVFYTRSCQQPQTTLKIDAPSQWKGKVAVLINSGSASASEMFSQNIKLGGAATLIGEKTVGVGNTSTFIFEMPAKRGLSVTAGRVSVNGQATTKYVNPDISSPDDKAKLAATGVDDALQIAYSQLLK